jgi:hypothetical protein
MDGILDATQTRGGGPGDQGGNCIFVDDVTSYGETFDAFLKHLKKLLTAMKSRRWRVNPKKLRLGYRKIKLLGWIVGEGGLEADPSKLEAVKQLKPPTTQKEVRAFLGLVGFYRRLIPRFAEDAKHLDMLLKKEAEW